jgi:hypothetical protein
MCQYCGTVTVRDSNPHCHCIRPHCYQYVRWPQLSKGCASIAVQLLYAIRILTVTVSGHTVNNMYGSHSCESSVPVLRYSYCTRFESLFRVFSLNYTTELRCIDFGIILSLNVKLLSITTPTSKTIVYRANETYSAAYRVRRFTVCPPDVTRVNKSRRMRCAGHVACTSHSVLVGNPEVNRLLETSRRK